MFNALVSKAPSVRITIEEEQIMVHPELVPGQPSQDPIVRGTVLLELASARAVNRIRVVFEGLSDAFGECRVEGGIRSIGLCDWVREWGLA